MVRPLLKDVGGWSAVSLRAICHCGAAGWGEEVQTLNSSRFIAFIHHLQHHFVDTNTIMSTPTTKAMGGFEYLVDVSVSAMEILPTSMKQRSARRWYFQHLRSFCFGLDIWASCCPEG